MHHLVQFSPKFYLPRRLQVLREKKISMLNSCGKHWVKQR